MAKVRAFAVAGLDLRFYSNDHDPPHFHAIKLGHWKITIHFTLCTTSNLAYEKKWYKTTGPKSADCKALLEQVLNYRHALLIEWEQSRPK